MAKYKPGDKVTALLYGHGHKFSWTCLGTVIMHEGHGIYIVRFEQGRLPFMDLFFKKAYIRFHVNSLQPPESFIREERPHALMVIERCKESVEAHMRVLSKLPKDNYEVFVYKCLVSPQATPRTRQLPYLYHTINVNISKQWNMEGCVSPVAKRMKQVFDKKVDSYYANTLTRDYMIRYRNFLYPPHEWAQSGVTTLAKQQIEEFANV